jgi:tetratricopeptide (TPR) repeat protein
VDQAVAAVYSVNRGLINSVHWRIGENRSDNTSFQYNPADRGGIPNEEIDEFLMNSSNGLLSSYWNQCYSGISRANFILANIDAVDYADETVKDSRRGEVLFLRSWFYFNLVRIFGDVPYVTTAGTSPEVIFADEFLTREAVAQVYSNILADVQQAIDLLPEAGNTQSGRATVGAALMLKAKMHMALQEYEEAVPLLESIRELGYSLQQDYASIFAPNNKNNSESIFEIQYSFALGQGSNFVSRFVPFNSGNDILGSSGPAGSRAGQNQPTQDLIDLYDPADERFQHNISFYDTGSKLEPWMSKYDFGFEDDGVQDINLPMFRYADALLMLAECRNEAFGFDQTSIALLNQIRLRAGVAPKFVGDVQELREAIATERRLELAFENHRWFDLVRTGRAVEVMTAHGEAQKAEKVTVTPEAYTNIRTLLGIPLREIEEFGFEQNPGW